MRWIGFVLLIATSSAWALGAGSADDAGLQFFETKIRPLLVENCYKCHSVIAKKIKANLYLDSREGVLKGGDNGPAIVLAHPDQSRMMEAISWGNPDLQMPPKKKLSEQQIADLTHWVKMGAPWPAGESPKPVAAVRVFDLQKRKASHWCWQLIKRPTPPKVSDEKWVQSPTDRFILAKIEQGDLQKAPPADRHVLIRRAYFDLIGLPPTPQEVDAFVNDASPDAFAKVVDHLLASEHFGERWARHWMDIVRYGETRGHEFDYVIPNAWQYRDYLIRAFNADVPYDQFVTEHIAGDLLKTARMSRETPGMNESILGTGFWFLGEEVHSPVDIRQDEADRLNNRIDTMTKAFLGLTVGCARCHDHKFDAISQKDFYALTGFTLSASYRQAPFASMEPNHQAAKRLDLVRVTMRKHFCGEILGSEMASLERMADYLLASRQIVLAGPRGPGQISEISTGRSLDANALGEWVQELARAKADDTHPLHAFALAAYDPATEQAAGFAAFRAKLVDGILAQERQAAAIAPPVQVLLDFDAQTPTPWYSDGIAFGMGPVRAGELLLGTTVEQPVLGVARWSMAQRDPFIKDLKPARGTETDVGRLGGWHRAGQTLRTSSVTLKTGRLWYLVHGAGRAYACVDSHLVINGPLHGHLTMDWNADKKDKWTWIQHDLSAYAGQRCHVEFSPVGDGKLEIARVVDADQPPPIETPNKILMSALRDPSIDSLDALARVYQKLFTSALDRLNADSVGGASDARDQAALADFMVRRRALFHGDPQLLLKHSGAIVDTTPSHTQDFAKFFISTLQHTAADIVTESPTAPAMWEGNGVDENVLVRGVAKNTGDVVPRRFLEAIAGPDQAPYPTDGSGRLQLAAAMLADNDPFASRVMVNRVWQHLFGRGIVPTVDNFGVLGQPPTHPELLDYLADNFRKEQHWSIKQLIRSIMLSSSYQMSSKASPASEQADPQNLTFNHMPIKRLEAEPIRDAILAVSGRLDPKVGGAPVDVYLTPFMEGRGRPGGGPLDGAGRRSLYTRIRRNFLSPMMLAFDQPIPFACVGRRNVSNVPAQALILMNDPMVVQQADLWAKRVLAEPGKSGSDRVRGMYMTAFSREPSPQELKDALAFLDQQGEGYGLAPEQRMTDPRPWADLCHVMFNLKEFIFIE